MRRAPVAVALCWGLVTAGTIVTAQQNPAPAPQRLEPGPMSPMTTGPTRTFTKDVAPILYKNCTGCHRPGTVAPMSLLTYKDARPWAKSIRDKIVDGEMPPWHADPKIGRFANARLLTEAERETLVSWANTGSREGDPADLPPAPTYTEGWSIGRPDLVARMEKSVRGAGRRRDRVPVVLVPDQPHRGQVDQGDGDQAWRRHRRAPRAGLRLVARHASPSTSRAGGRGLRHPLVAFVNG